MRKLTKVENLLEKIVEIPFSDTAFVQCKRRLVKKIGDSDRGILFNKGNLVGIQFIL